MSAELYILEIKKLIEKVEETQLSNIRRAAELIAAELLAREEKMTTGIGQGVAIPHARSAHVGDAVAALGVSPGGLDFSALDEQPVQIVFTFITPETHPALHIQTLAHAVALFGSDDVRRAIVGADEPAAVLEILGGSRIDFGE